MVNWWISKTQQEYYDVLAAYDKIANSSQFIEFILKNLLQTLEHTHTTDQVKSLLNILQNAPLSATECMNRLGLSHRPTFRKNYLNPAQAQNLIERPIPDKPNSRLQKYRLR